MEAQTSSLPPGLMSAGGPGWYSVVAISFFLCEFNPIGGIGIAFGLKLPSRSPIEWGLTATSFLLALAGFMITERIALAEQARRPLEIASIIAIAAGIIPAIVGTTMPPLIMWPIAAMFLLIGASGLRAARKLPQPAAPQDSPQPADSTNWWLSQQPAAAAQATTSDADAPAAPQSSQKRRRRRRRHHHNRKRRASGSRRAP